MLAHYWWWLLALVLGILELLSGTFYLLVLAVGCVAGGLVAAAMGGLAVQALTAAIVAFLGWGVLHRLQRRRRDVPAQANPDVLLDIGQRVHVDGWNADGRAHAMYRGARWEVELEQATGAGSGPPAAGEYQIRRLSGNCLVVAPLRQ